MIDELRHFVIVDLIRYDHAILRLNGNDFSRELRRILLSGGPVVWENQGSFRYIPHSVIANLRTRYEIARSIQAIYPQTKPPPNLMEITWDQGIPFPAEIARDLLSPPDDGSDESGSPESTTGPSSEDQADQP